MKHYRTRIYGYFLLVAAIVIIIDQITKQLAMRYLSDGNSIVLFDYLQFVLVFNKGAAFGMLSQAGGWQFYLLSALAVVVSIVLLRWVWLVCTDNRQLALALTLILAGAVGNLIDRLIYQFVIDFILAHYKQYQFPAFNIADSMITIGAVLLIADSFGWQLLWRGDDKQESQDG